MNPKNEIQFRLKISGGTQYYLRLLGVTIWVSNHFRNAGWFRFFGAGLKWKHQSLGLIFSERNGYVKYFKLGQWIIGYLPRK